MTYENDKARPQSTDNTQWSLIPTYLHDAPKQAGTALLENAIMMNKLKRPITPACRNPIDRGDGMLNAVVP